MPSSAVDTVPNTPSPVRARRVPRWRKRVGKWWRAIRQVMRLASPRHRALVIVGTFVSSILDLVGLTMMVPLIIAATDLKESSKGIVVAMGKALAFVGLPFEPMPILVVIIIGLALKALVGVLVTPLCRHGRGQGDAVTCGFA